MKELKTLKDLSTETDYPNSEEIAKIDELRQEAIKWYKELNQIPFENIPENFDYGTNIQEWIKHFFNITDEELK